MRKKIKLTWIANEVQRKQSFKKRKSGLVKKVKELTTLCGVSAFIVIRGPGEDSPTVWPSPEVARFLIDRFRAVPEMERCKKMVNQESYLRERATKMREQLRKAFRRNQENVTSYVMHEYGEGKPLSQFTMSELGSVLWLLEEKMKEIKRRLEFYRQPHRYYDRADGVGSTSFTLPPPTAEEMTGSQEFPWQCFFGSPLGLQPVGPNNYNCLGASSSSSSGGGGAGGSRSLQAYGDYFRVGNDNNNMSPNGGTSEVGLGLFGYFGGGTSTHVTTSNNIVGGMSVHDLDLAPEVTFGGIMPNNGGNNNQNPSCGHNIGFGGNNGNLGFGQGSSLGAGNNVNSNGMNFFQINNNYINATSDAGYGVLGQAQENNVQGDFNNALLNNGAYAAGSDIGAPISSEQFFVFPSNARNGNTDAGNDAAGSSSGDFCRYWSGIF